MNNQGVDFIKKISENVKRKEKETGLKCPDFSMDYSRTQERIMRLGIEAKAYSVNSQNIKELEMLAIATLKQDWCEKQ